MKSKRLLWFAVVFVVLGALYYFLESPGGKKKAGEPEELIPGFSKDRVAAIEIKSPDQSGLRLTLQAGLWQVHSDNQTYAADVAAIEKLIETAAGLSAGTVVSKNPEKFEAFEVSGGKGVAVKMLDASGETLAGFVVGKSGPDIFSTYVRIEGTDRVFLSGGILKNTFDRQLKDWRDKTILKLAKGDITAYTISGDLALSLEQNDQGQWQVLSPAPFALKQDTVKSALEGFCSLKAADFVTGPLAEFGLEEPARTITATLKDQTPKTLLVGKEKNAYQRYVKIAGAETIYVLENYKLESISPALDQWKAPDPDNATAPSPDNETQT